MAPDSVFPERSRQQDTQFFPMQDFSFVLRIIGRVNANILYAGTFTVCK